MNWFISLLRKLAWHSRVIPDRLNTDKPYLTRHYLIGGPKHRWFTVCLHEFHCSDPTDLHDHPFSYLTLVLSGGYWEDTSEGRFWRAPGHLRYRSARSLHRIELDPSSGPVFTLFFMGRRVRDWGFVKQAHWIDHDTYLKGLACSSSTWKVTDSSKK